MGYFQVRYDSRVVIYDHRAFIRLAIGLILNDKSLLQNDIFVPQIDVAAEAVVVNLEMKQKFFLCYKSVPC